MDNSKKPRHIRDIAHLYLSRLPRKSGERRRRVFVLASSRECFGGFHAANIALGFVRNGFAVELIEASGRLPCAGYFLRLPPEIYIKHRTQSPNESLSALGGVSVRYSHAPPTGGANGPAPGLAVGPRRGRAGTIEVVHLPPAGDMEAMKNVLDVMPDAIAPSAVPRAVVLAPDEARAREAGRNAFSGMPAVDWTTLSLEKRITTTDRPADTGHSLGYLVGWRTLLSDPVPCVVRDPESHVSRSYLSICDALVLPGAGLKERNEGKSPRRSASLGQIR